MERTVGQVAAAAGVSVRTLHHWESLGLVAPARRATNGYRAYGDQELARVRAVAAWRELGLSLEAIRDLLAGGAPTEVLEQHLALLEDEARRVAHMRAAVVRALEARRMGIELDPAEVREVFGDEDPAAHAAETEARWGGTPEWAEAQRRTSGYTKDDWLRMRAEQDDLEGRMAAAMAAGVPAEQATTLADEHRRLLERWFHDVTPEHHVALAQLYVGDERFTAHYDRRAPGLARWLRDAIVALHA